MRYGRRCRPPPGHWPYWRGGVAAAGLGVASAGLAVPGSGANSPQPSPSSPVSVMAAGGANKPQPSPSSPWGGITAAAPSSSTITWAVSPATNSKTSSMASRSRLVTKVQVHDRYDRKASISVRVGKPLVSATTLIRPRLPSSRSISSGSLPVRSISGLGWKWMMKVFSAVGGGALAMAAGFFAETGTVAPVRAANCARMSAP